MKAAIVLGPNRLVVAEAPRPAPREYDALCRLLCGATCGGTDLHLITAAWPWTLQYPFILGHESVGKVVQVGAKVRHLKVGDLVTRVGVPASADGSLGSLWGGFAEYGLARDHRAMREDGVDRQQWRNWRANQKLDPVTDPGAATMIITWRETLSYLTRMGVGKEHAVLVLGSGANGLSFAAHAANAGAALVVMVGSPAREPVARRLGVAAYVDYSDPDWPGKAAVTCPDRFNFIIDAVGKKGTMASALPLLRPGGTIGIYGLDDVNNTTINPRLARGTFTYYNGHYDEEEAHESVMALIAEGRLRASDWLDLAHPFPLDSIQDAFAAVRERRVVKALVRL